MPLDASRLVFVLAATAAVVLLTAPTASAVAAPPAYEAKPGPVQADPAFHIKYTGSSSTRTSYRGTPPNPGGAADLNTVRDESRQEWALTYPAGVTIPTCGPEPDPCAAVAGPSVAEGRMAGRGKIDHKHVDGLYDQLDATERCRVKAKALPRTGLRARIDVAYDPVAAAFKVTPLNPIDDLLILLPPTCPQRPDGIDRILDNYFMPGFSYSQDYGADRWFTPEPVAVPVDVWHTSTQIRLRVGLAAAGRPPKDCATRYTYERCRTTGSWSGTLTFTRR